MLRDDGLTYEEIGKVLFITHEAVRQHFFEYESFGKIKPENGGSSEKLNSIQSEMLSEHLEENLYQTTKEIIAYIEAVFNVSFSVSGMNKWLKAHDFSYKKPTLVPGKADKKAQEKWIESYKEMKKELPENETVLFMDGVHPTHNVKLAYGWIKTGTRKELPSNTGRQRINISGAVSLDDYRVYTKEDQSLNAESTIAFLKYLEELMPDKAKIHVYCDNARYYKNKAVGEFLTTSRVQLHFLPPYSPNLNPIERYWKFMKEQILNNKYYEKFSDFKFPIFNFIGTCLDPPKNLFEVLKSRLTDNFKPLSSPLLDSF